MARGRMLNKTVSASLKFAALPDDTCRLLATWIIPHLDKNGVYYGNAALVRSYVFPLRDDITTEQVEGYLGSLESVGLMYRFSTNGREWQHWPGFDENQVGLRKDREGTEFPDPPALVQEDAEPIPVESGNLPAGIQQDSDNLPAQIKGKEVKSKSNGREDNDPADAEPTSHPPPLTVGQREFLDLFGGKRYKNNIQKDTILELEQRYGTTLLLEAGRWAAKKGMTVSHAIGAVESALPNWGDGKGKARASPGNAKEPAGWQGIREWMQEEGVEWQPGPQ